VKERGYYCMEIKDSYKVVGGVMLAGAVAAIIHRIVGNKYPYSFLTLLFTLPLLPSLLSLLLPSPFSYSQNS
jgi:hypothetical protein